VNPTTRTKNATKKKQKKEEEEEEEEGENRHGSAWETDSSLLGGSFTEVSRA
jgi:hypothetical protein